MVSYRSSDGNQTFRPIDDLGEAIEFVEHLRNDEAVDQARLYRMEELSFEFRPYYRVELADGPAPIAEAMVRHLGENEHEEGVADNPPPPPAGQDDVDPLAAVWSASDREE